MRTITTRYRPVFSMLILLSYGTAHAESMYIVAGSLIDPLNGTVISNPVVEIQGDRIVAVSSGGQVSDNAEVINLESSTILPGLADLHTHLTWDPSDLGYEGLVNAYTPIYMRSKGEAMGMLRESIDKARELAEKRLQTYRTAIKAGVKIVYGSDSATYPHGDNAKQFSVYVDLGMSPMEAIQSATTVAAESLGLVGDTGAVAAGYFADVIAVEGDPLEHISVLENVTFVMKGGHVYKSPR